MGVAPHPFFPAGLSGTWQSLLPVYTEASGGSLNELAPAAFSQIGSSMVTLIITPAATIPECIASVPDFTVVPPKLVQKIMRELLPELGGWRMRASVVAATLSARGAASSLTLVYGWSAMLPWQQL